MISSRQFELLDFCDLMISAAWETFELQYEYLLTNNSVYGKLAKTPNYMIPVRSTNKKTVLNYKFKAYCSLSHF